MQTPSQKLYALSYAEAFCYALMVATSESFALFLAVRLGLSPRHIALLTNIPPLFGALSQWITPYFIAPKHMGVAILGFMGVQIFGLFGLFQAYSGHAEFFMLLLSITLYWIGGMSSIPLWIEWMSNRTGNHSFREFLSSRNAFITFTTLTMYVVIALVYDHFPKLPFHLIFGVGILARLSSMVLQAIIYHNPALVALQPIQKLPLAESSTVISSPGTDFFEKEKLQGKEIHKLLRVTFLFIGFFKFSVCLASPFFLPYMLRELHLSLIHYVIITSIPLLGRFVFLKGWGRASHGVRPFLALQIASSIICINPFLWTLTENFVFLNMIEFISGVFWGGFELACILVVQNLISEKKSQWLGIHMAIMNFLSVLGGYIGGYLLESKLHYFSIFYLSSSLRFCMAVLYTIYIMRKVPSIFNRLSYKSFIKSCFPY